MTTRVLSLAIAAQVARRSLAANKRNGMIDSKIPLFSAREFHASLSASMGRRTGSKALEPLPRSPSKKQAKRWTRKTERSAERLDHGKEKTKLGHMEKMFDSEDMKEFVHDLSRKLKDPVKEMMLPDGGRARRPDVQQLTSGRRNVSLQQPSEKFYLNMDPNRVMNKLRSLKAIYAAQLHAHQQQQPIGRLATPTNHPPQSQQGQVSPLDLGGATATATAATGSRGIVAPPAVAAGMTTTGGAELPPPPSPPWGGRSTEKLANLCARHYAKAKDMDRAIDCLRMMQYLQIAIHPSTVPSLIFAATNCQQFELADKLFQEALADDSCEVGLLAWTAMIKNKARSGRVNEAVALLNQLQKLKIRPTATMYTIILNAYVLDPQQRDLKAAEQFWLRMHDDDVDIERLAFITMFKVCRMTRNAERAFFYFDEMECYGLEPSIGTFRNFFAACATAPHFVSGFEDTMYDAMAKMEGKELMPDANIYTTIIKAFASARDPVAAEYYFWEMHRKGYLDSPGGNDDGDWNEYTIASVIAAYENLLQAYAMAQSVGARSYGTEGRYARPPRPSPTPDQQAMLDLGSRKLTSMLTAGIESDYEYVEGKRTKRPILRDIRDEDPSYEEEVFMPDVRYQASEARRMRATRVDSTATTTASDSINAAAELPHSLLQHHRQLMENSTGAGVLNDEKGRFIDVDDTGSDAISNYGHDDDDSNNNNYYSGDGLTALYEDLLAEEMQKDSNSKNDGDTSRDLLRDLEVDGLPFVEYMKKQQRRGFRDGIHTSGGKEEEEEEEEELPWEDDEEEGEEEEEDNIDGLNFEFNHKYPIKDQMSLEEIELAETKRILADTSSSVFADPFQHMSDLTGVLVQQERQQLHQQHKMLQSIDGDEKDVDSDGSANNSSSDNSRKVLDGREATTRRSWRSNVALLDGSLDAEGTRPPASAGAPMRFVPPKSAFSSDALAAAAAAAATSSSISSSSSSSRTVGDSLHNDDDAITSSSRGIVDVDSKDGEDGDHEHLFQQSQSADAQRNETAAVSASAPTPKTWLDEEIATEWDRIYFGRAPAADYSAPLNARRDQNIHRAELAFQHLLQQLEYIQERQRGSTTTTTGGGDTSALSESSSSAAAAAAATVTVRALNMLLLVYSEAGREAEAYEVFSRFGSDQFPSLVPNLSTYRSLVVMHVKNKNISKAVATKEEMTSRGIQPDPLTYGLLLQSLCHREQLVEALQLLEEAAQKKVKVPERHLCFLRSRCRTLGIRHPQLREEDDPKQWVREVRARRRKHKHASQRNIEPLRNALYK